MMNLPYPAIGYNTYVIGTFFQYPTPPQFSDLTSFENIHVSLPF